MNENDLSAEARMRLEELTPEIDAVDHWGDAYLELLNKLAHDAIPPLEDVEIKNQGIEALEQSRRDHAVREELQKFARAFIGQDISKDVAKFDDGGGFDDFLCIIMPKQSTGERLALFMDFLRYEARLQIENDPPPPGVEEREDTALDWIEKQAAARFASLMRSTMPALVCHDIAVSFLQWWKTQDKGNPLAAATKARSDAKAETKRKMLKLLPKSKRANETISRRDWCEKAKLVLNLSSRAFDRYLQELRAAPPPGFIERSKNRFRLDPGKAVEQK